ncbi:MAG: rhomboid family intramembrane serine protease [Hyphomicrobiaceae bacterium]|nr:rhomboid family intramembrane serine protease [Hyphomicrobiaceae bacterium]
MRTCALIQRNEPMFNVPASVPMAIAILVAIHVVRTLLPDHLDAWFVVANAFVPSRYSGEAELLPGGVLAVFTSPLTYQLIHGDLTHLAFNSLWLLAFGGAIALRAGSLRCFVFALVCGIIAAFAFLVLNWGTRLPMIGASGAIAGLMGGTMRFLFSAIDMGGIWRLREAPRSVPLMPVMVALTDRRVLVATAILIAINLLTLVGVSAAGVDAAAIAWESHIGGYMAGLLLFGLFDSPAPRQPKRPDLRVVH